METSRDDETPITLFTARQAVRVLVIDPQDEARVQMVASLRKTGAEVTALTTPAGATATMLGNRIEVLVLDAGIDGFADRFIAMLRQNPLLDHVGILLTASGVGGGFDEVAQSLGADGFVSKAASTSDLGLSLGRARALARRRVRSR